METAPIIVIGAGQAGLQAAESLRAEGYQGPVVMIGAEPALPYHRPPLSKDVLLGDASPEQITIRGPEALDRKGITARTGVAVTAINRADRSLTLDSGETLAYSGLVLATGARVRPLPIPGADLAGVFPLRTLADSLALLERLKTARHVVVIGGGFIGLEVAAAARKSGAEVVVFEAADRLMARAVSPPLSDYYLGLHRRHGVTVHLGAMVRALHGTETGDISGVETADGQVHPADVVIYGIGVIPEDGLAKAAGLACENGIVVDTCSRTEDPLIVAAGDCTVVRMPETGALRRLESVQNAVEQAKAAAAALMGKDKPFTRAPWFWSTQFGLKLQMVGTSAGHDRLEQTGDPAEDSFSLYYYREGRLIGVDSVARPQDHMAARKLVEEAAEG